MIYNLDIKKKTTGLSTCVRIVRQLVAVKMNERNKKGDKQNIKSSHLIES